MLFRSARSDGETVRDEDAFKLVDFRESADNTSLDDEEKSDIENLLRSLHDIPRWRSCFLSPDSLGDTVLLSEERKTYLDLFVERRLLPERKEDWDRDVVKEVQAMSVLGVTIQPTLLQRLTNCVVCITKSLMHW